MTDNEAYRLAVEALLYAMKPLAVDANIAKLDPQASPSMKEHRKKWLKYNQAVAVIEGKIAQRKMEIPGDNPALA